MRPAGRAAPDGLLTDGSADMGSGRQTAGGPEYATATGRADARRSRDGVAADSGRRAPPRAPRVSAEPHVARGAAAVGPVRPPAHLVRGVALDCVDRAVGVDRLDDADVAAAPDDQVAGRRRRA